MSTVTSVSPAKKSETEILNFLLAYTLDNELPLAVWRLPHSKTCYLVISNQHRSLASDATLEDLPQGFLFAPFDREKPGLFLPGDFVFRFEDNTLLSPETPVEQLSATWLAEKMQAGELSSPRGFGATGMTTTRSASDFKDVVSKGIGEINKGILEKVVPSRCKLIDLPENFDLVQSFEKLCATYGHALVSFVSIPGIGHWLGATPEVLVTVEDNTIFRTVALAGTMPFKEGMNLRNIAWTQKEIEEQALVERYVISCFKKIRLREYDEHGPKTVVAGNLVHLKSDFTVDMKATNFPQLGSVMLHLLHPTSAVCGMPLEASLNFLKQHEGFDREFYAGYLGPVNINRNINIFVNLRCMKLMDQKAMLYAGAGVTIDSIPGKELEETEIKFSTLLNVIC